MLGWTLQLDTMIELTLVNLMHVCVCAYVYVSSVACVLSYLLDSQVQPELYICNRTQVVKLHYFKCVFKI